MSLETLDGYLTAIVIGPNLVMPSQWMPGIWGPGEENAPRYETLEQAQRILELIMRHMNGIVWTLEENPDEFEPFVDTVTYDDDPQEYPDGEMWSYGFME